ncbi:MULTISPECIES: hypothetical protein [unclassified Okeania]|nr:MULTISPECIES: hypothetical protein [unclassified Okeania]
MLIILTFYFSLTPRLPDSPAQQNVEKLLRNGITPWGLIPPSV